MKRRLFTTLALAATVIGVGPVASGQERFNRLQTNLAGVVTAGAPPAGFDGLIAPDADLAAYGLPPRPNEGTEPRAFAAWKKAITASKHRVLPRLEQTNVFHGPARRVLESAGTSNNWSAVVDYTGATGFDYANSFHYIAAEYVVPAATQAYGACTGNWDFSSTWVGLDGSGSNDVLQAGTESDAFCNGGKTTPFYSAWYEWYPYGEVQISNFPVAPGDDLFVEVWNSSPTEGHVYFLNYTRNESVELEFTPPPGTALVGNSAEWVVERPGVNGGLATLTNYVSDYLSNCFAATWNQVVFTPGMPSAQQLTMLDDSSKPISFPTVLGESAIWFQDEGSAR